MARRALSISSWEWLDFMARNRPPTFTRGRHSSQRMGRAATARLRAASKLSRRSLANSSALAWTQAVLVRPRAPQLSRKNSTRFPRLSSSVICTAGRAMATGTPGNPAPVPTSTTVPASSPARGSRDRLSSRWSRATSLGSVMAVRFIT